MGSIATASPNRSLTDSAIIQAQTLPGLGAPIAMFKYSGALIDFALTANGDTGVGTFTSPPTDAVALEMWVNANAPTDYLFFATKSGNLSNAGVTATNVTANLLVSRWVASGQLLTIPLAAVGAVPAGFRFASGVASGARAQGRYLSQSSLFPYLLGTAEHFTLTGAGGSQQFPYGNTFYFPVGYVGAWFQILGTGVARCTIDGTTPTASVGAILLPGLYYVDFAKHGVSAAALRFFLPSGLNICGNSLLSA